MAGTFTLFGKLPTELRLKIWEFAIPGPRVVYLDLVRCEDNTAHMAEEDEEHDSLSVSGSLEEGTTTAENADPVTLQEERVNPETQEERMGQSPIGNLTASNSTSGTGESGSGDSDSEESSNEESGGEDIEEATPASDSESETDHGDSEEERALQDAQRRSRYLNFLETCHGYSDEEDDRSDIYVAALTFRSDCSPPSLLFVCHDSRDLALKYYQKTFGTAYAPARTYFDFDRDTIYIRYDVFSPNSRGFEDFLEELFQVREGGLMMVRNAAVLVDETFEARRGELHELLVADMLERVFPRLQNLTIVLAHEAPENSDKAPIRFIEPIDYEVVLSAYENYSRDRAWQKKGPVDVRMLYYAKVRPKFLKKQIARQHGWYGEDTLWPPLIPAIEYKIAITSSQERHLESVRRAAENVWKEVAQEVED
jgi:hypothetical protein